MELLDYLRTVRRQWLLFVAGVVVCVLLAVGYILLATRVYAASTDLFVAQSATDTPQERVEASDFALDRVKSYVYVVDSKIVLDPVIEQLGLSTTADELARHVSASVPTDTVVLAIRVTDTDREEAARIADAVAARFIVVATDLEDPQSANTTVTITVVESADVPQDPISPNRKLIIGLGLLLGVSLGFAAAVVRELWDKRVRSEADIRTVTEHPIIGRIPLDTDPAVDRLLTGDALHGSRAEAFRQLRTNLQFLNIERDHRSYVITSASEGEGKTVTAINLALTLMDADISVCLVDADMRQPRIAQYLGLSEDRGLADILIGNVSVDDAARTWDDTPLRVITAGHRPPNPSELLASGRMHRLMGELERRAQIVVIDSPPLLAVTDAAIISRHASGVLMLVGFGGDAVSRPQLQRTLDDLEAVGAGVLGVVLNKMPKKGAGAIEESAYSRYRSFEPGPETT